MINRNLFPDNLVRATFQTLVTKYETSDTVVEEDINGTITYETSKYMAFDDSINILGNTVMFALVLVLNKKAELL